MSMSALTFLGASLWSHSSHEGFWWKLLTVLSARRLRCLASSPYCGCHRGALVSCIHAMLTSAGKLKSFLESPCLRGGLGSGLSIRFTWLSVTALGHCCPLAGSSFHGPKREDTQSSLAATWWVQCNGVDVFTTRRGVTSSRYDPIINVHGLLDASVPKIGNAWGLFTTIHL